MRRIIWSTIPVLLLSACADSTTGPVAASARPSFAKSSPEPNAAFTVYLTMSDGITPTHVFGDGRLANGAPAPDSSIYQGGLCGVKALIFVSASGDAVLDPAGASGPCGARRSLSFDFGSGVVSYAPFVNVHAVVQLQLGESRPDDIRFTNMGAPGCDALRYSGPSDGTSSMRVTRTANPLDPNVWTMESEPPHIAGCYAFSKGQYRFVQAYVMPVHFEIRQLP
jgi:hypothetical protein